MNNPAFVIGGVGLVRSLGEVGIPVLIGSDVTTNIALSSRYCRGKAFFSHFAGDQFPEELERFGKQQKNKLVFFSDDDRAVVNFNRNRKRLEPYFMINMPDIEVVDTLMDKRKFTRHAMELGLPVPVSFTPENEDHAAEIARKIPYPCVIKPTYKEDWWHKDFLRIVGPYRKAIECANAKELLDYYRKIVQINPGMVIQEFIAGNDEQLYSMNSYVNKDFETLAFFIGKKHRIYPIHAGIGCFVETIESKEIEAIGKESARKLGIRGYFNIQFKRDSRTGELKIMEVHVRNSVWAYLATQSGVNISAIGYYDMLGEKYPHPIRYRTGVKYWDLNNDLKAFVDYRKAGEWTFGRWFGSLKGRLVFNIPSLSDPKPMIVDWWHFLLRRASGKVKKGAAPPG